MNANDLRELLNLASSGGEVSNSDITKLVAPPSAPSKAQFHQDVRDAIKQCQTLYAAGEHGPARRQGDALAVKYSDYPAATAPGTDTAGMTPTQLAALIPRSF